MLTEVTHYYFTVNSQQDAALCSLLFTAYSLYMFRVLSSRITRSK